MDDDDFDFSDADLDDLPANTLQQLETTAIRATQQQNHHHDNAVAEEEDSAYYGFDDGDEDEVVNLDDTRGAAHFPNNDANGYQVTQRDNGANVQYDAAMEVEEAPPQSQIDVGRLLERIKKLEQEKRRLNHNLETTSAEVIKKTGEADNLRRRTEHATRQTEQRLAQQQQEHKESTGRITAERDALLRQLEQSKTNSAFDEHSRQEEQMRRPRRVVPARPKPTAPVTASPAGTPSKIQKNLPLGDGFDDDDVVMASPSKRRDKSKTGTPKQASKRKRQITNDSPVPILELSEPRTQPKVPEPPSFSEAQFDITLLRNLWKHDQRYTLLRRLLSHRCSRGDDRILEALTQYAFPSDPAKKLSSVVYDSFSTSAPTSSARELAISVCGTFVNIWKQCLREKYYAPIYLLLDALQFVLACEPAKTAIPVMEDVMPLIVESVKLVAIPVYEARNRNEKKSALLFSPEYQTTVDEVDVQSCLDLLYLLATCCISCPSSEPLSRFWRNMPLDFVLLMLLKEQPVGSMLVLLRTLSTSALPTSLGPIISSDPETQKGGESNLLTRLTNLFSEPIAPIADPKSTSHAHEVPESQIWRVRLKILDVLTQFSIPEYGSTILISHALCIGRLIKYLNHAVSALYSRPLSPTQPEKIATINATMKLLNHLTTSNPGFNIKSKLNETLGGLHAYYVSLTRLAFSEGLVLEAGIEQEVMDMAHDILDDGLSPEEGDALAEVFPSGNTV
ncbi:uncharacterized protein N0V89_005309 [Didymosphaeria variabile]|uniref:DNA repair protein Rad26 n=1 Tax=Didymosphaeria variabile TaxID=1932322 RepID=A0A9W8XLD2_9PLEO|nr:uncharacterized protein N0V89_005309 [Didymosphaeria variabile]KAJ4353579.1 hypothetical protein N0V89_005309 [Didymosphaeria variabile]